MQYVVINIAQEFSCFPEGNSILLLLTSSYRIIYNNVWEVLHSHQKKAKLSMANMTVILGEEHSKILMPKRNEDNKTAS